MQNRKAWRHTHTSHTLALSQRTTWRIQGCFPWQPPFLDEALIQALPAAMGRRTSGSCAASTLSALLRLRCSPRSEAALSLRRLRAEDMRWMMGLRGLWRRPAESGAVDSTCSESSS